MNNIKEKELRDEFQSKFNNLYEFDKLSSGGFTRVYFKVLDFWLLKIKEAVMQEEDRHRRNIGLLRQYLNERTSKDLITNEEIETFLK